MTEKAQGRLGVTTTLAIAFVVSLWIGVLVGVAFGIRDGSLLSLWTTIGDGQAQLLSSAIAALGLLTSAVLVPFLFKDRIRDLDGAVADMQGTLNKFEGDASGRLERLASLFEEKLAVAEQRSAADADRIGEVSMRSGQPSFSR